MYRTDDYPPLYRWNIFDKYSDLVNAGISSRSGGSSTEVYKSFNQALHCGDNAEDVIKNRKSLCQSQNIPFDNYTCAEQVHGAKILKVDEQFPGSGKDSYDQSISKTDALIIDRKDIFINIHVADCVPIAIFDYSKKVGALIHAGWRGTAHLITDKTIRYMTETLNCNPENMIAGLGPSIGSCCFEISWQIAEVLKNSFHYSDRVILKNKEQYRADLKQANREQLVHQGLKEENIEISSICTCCCSKEFYSYRAEKGKTGRFAAFMNIC